VVTDTCLPVKVFIGHVISLADKCDRILIPVVRSTRDKVYNCSRFLGLPDVARAVVPEAPPILEIEFDVSRGKSYLYQQVWQLGKHFTLNAVKIRKAARYAWQVFNDYRDLMLQERITRDEAIRRMETGTPASRRREQAGTTTIGIVGHPYVLYDDEISHRLISRLRGRGIRILTPEMAPAAEAAGEIPGREVGLSKSYWESEEDVIDAGDYYVKAGVDGIIGAMAFSCGPDSMMMHLVQRQAQDADIPFMCLTLEEHTAEAGIITRLEAFLDMLERRKTREKACV
jgi:predicted nucleotide-binding protein (sugar kinase/HSP70/actin superfamily)